MKDATAAYDIVCSSAFQQRHHRHESRVQVYRGTYFNSLACGPCVLEMKILLLTGQHLCSIIWSTCVVVLLSLTESYATILNPE